ncbi:hypothetical protein PV620_05455 [Streptomyces sp. ME02-6978a]|uniref:hypothetical protein n=1 Tax=unclassified Streptomyces TaxID=2593676 RepID=UPI0029AF0E8B|nr:MULTISPECIES: hypothetical protein [unclassified Streptomyces]MDX3087802.1 hypothetical protein [Streptomyces sp. ME12-02E]MDX3331018.1 hypothetical protein [Streptomyces sp. ME02-6978a]
MVYSADKLEEMYPDTIARTNILRLRGIGRLMSESIVIPRYKIPANLHEPLAFTEAGEKLVRELKSSRGANWGEQRIAVFLQLHHDELFVDPERTDIPALRAGLSEEIKKGRIIHPFIWGRELYDKAFNDVPASNLHSLNSKRSIEFLEGAPKGVFQVSDTIVGPWGALQGEEFRYVPPTLSPRLYHCERPGCLRAHQTRLNTSDNSIITVRNRLAKKLFQRGGSNTNWSRFLSPLESRLYGRYDDGRSGDIVGLITECFSDVELHAITLTAFGDRSLDLRKKCSAEGIVVRDANDFLRGLSKAEIAQLLLLMPDAGIYRAIDSAIRAGEISIPSGEIRSPQLNGRRSGYFETTLQCSNRGVRAHSANSWTAMRRIRRLIRDVYAGSTYEAHLQWKIRDIEGATQDEKLDNYIASSEIHEIIRDLFLSGPDVFRRAADKIGLLGENPRSDSELISDFTWKLGFPLDLDDRGASDLRDNAKALRRVAAEFSHYGEEQKKALRSHSPNLFVSLEEVLDRALVFATWLTTVDHWMAMPRFTFFRDDARKHMALLLSSYSAQKDDPVTFNENGVNTLFPLISGFGLLASYLETEASHADEHIRDESEFPEVFRETSLMDFGYRSRLPFLNFSSEARGRLIQTLRAVSRELSTGDISRVRNSLEHHKGTFPNQGDIFRCVDAIACVCDTIEDFGILPMVFKMKSLTRDSEWRSEYIYEDYSGRGVRVTAPSTVVVTGGPGISQNQIFVPGLISAGSNWVPRFIPGVRSDFTEMWQEWPRSRMLSENFIEAPEVLGDSGDESALEVSGSSGL